MFCCMFYFTCDRSYIGYWDVIPAVISEYIAALSQRLTGNIDNAKRRSRCRIHAMSVSQTAKSTIRFTEVGRKDSLTRARSDWTNDDR